MGNMWGDCSNYTGEFTKLKKKDRSDIEGTTVTQVVMSINVFS